MTIMYQFCKFSKKNGAYVIINMFRNITALFFRQFCNYKFFLTTNGIIHELVLPPVSGNGDCTVWHHSHNKYLGQSLYNKDYTHVIVYNKMLVEF